MIQKIINLEAIQADLNHLEELLTNTPVGFQKRTAAFLAGDLPVVEVDDMRGKYKGNKPEHTDGSPTYPVMIRLPNQVLNRVDQLLDYVAGLPEIGAMEGKVTRTTVIKLAIHYGLEHLEMAKNPVETMLREMQGGKS